MISGHAEIFINHHYFPAVLPRRRHVFITTAYQLIYGLGFPLLRYVLGRFKGRFAELMELMETWAERRGQSAVCDQAAIERYFAETFGEGHHLTGLVRYMLNATELRRRVTNGVRGQAVSGTAEDGTFYALSPRAAVLRRVPDCPNILARLVEPDAERPAGALLRRRFDLLLHFPPSETDAIRNFELSRAGAAFLDCFRAPRRWPDEEGFERELGFPPPPASFLDALVERGVLELCVDART